MDARRSPEPIGQAHLPDQPSDLPWYPRPTALRARLPAPIQSEARPMPPDDGFRLDNRDSVQHRRKQTIDPDEEQSVRHRQLRPRGYALTQHTQLMAQQYDLSFQPRLRLDRCDQDMEEQDQERDHCGSAYLFSPLTPARMAFLVGTGNFGHAGPRLMVARRRDSRFPNWSLEPCGMNSMTLSGASSSRCSLTSRVAYRGWMWPSKRKELSVGKLQLVDGNCRRTVRLLL